MKSSKNFGSRKKNNKKKESLKLQRKETKSKASGLEILVTIKISNGEWKTAPGIVDTGYSKSLGSKIFSINLWMRDCLK